MQRALLIAKRSLLNGNIPIGSVLTNKNFEIGIGFNFSDSKIYPYSHAEINTVKQSFFYCSNKYLHNSVLYVTLEPCFICLSTLFYSKIKYVVFAAYYTDNIKTKIKFKHINEYKSIGGVMKEESNTLLNIFFKNKN